MDKNDIHSIVPLRGSPATCAPLQTLSQNGRTKFKCAKKERGHRINRHPSLFFSAFVLRSAHSIGVHFHDIFAEF